MGKKEVGKVGAKTNFPLVESLFSANFIGGSAVNKQDYYGFEPQRRNNGFLFVPLQELKGISGFPAYLPGTLAMALKSVELPKDENEIIELGYFNQKRFYAGQHRTQEISMVFVDYVDVPVAHALEFWRATVYNAVNGAVGWASSSPKAIIPSLAGYKQDVFLMTLSPNADWVYSKIYMLKGAFPSSIDRGDIDFADEDILEMTLTIHYDEVFLISHGWIPEIALYYNPMTAGDIDIKLEIPT